MLYLNKLDIFLIKNTLLFSQSVTIMAYCSQIFVPFQDKKKMSIEKEELKELKEEMAEYQEDIQELHKLKAEAKGLADVENIKVSKGAKRLFNKVNRMISKMDTVLSELEQSEKRIKEEIDALPSEKRSKSKVAAELIKIDELIAAIKQIQNVPDDHRLTRISEILGKIDDDRDGAIKIEDVLKVRIIIIFMK